MKYDYCGDCNGRLLYAESLATGVCTGCRNKRWLKGQVTICNCKCGCPLYHPESKKTGICSNCRSKTTEEVVYYYRG